MESGAQVRPLSMTAIVLERCDSAGWAAFRDLIVVSVRSRTQEPANFPGKMQREERRQCDEHKSWVLTAGDLLLRGDHAAPGSPLSFDVAGRKGEEPTKRTPRFRVTPPPSRRKGQLPPFKEVRPSPPAAPRIGLIVEPLKKKRRNESQSEAGPFTSSTWQRRRRR